MPIDAAIQKAGAEAAEQHDSGADAASQSSTTPVVSSASQNDATEPAAKDGPQERGAGGLAERVGAEEQEKAPALGAGGTSPAVKEPAPDEAPTVGRGGGGGKVAGAAAAVPAAGAAGQVMLLAMIINWLKGLMFQLMAIAANLWNLALGLLLAMGKAAFGAVIGVGTAISSAVGGAVSAVVAGVASFAAGGVVITLVVVSSVMMIDSGNAVAMRDSTVGCQVVAKRALDKVDGSDTNVDASTLANAKTIYSVLSAWGMPDENIAGIIGNWDAESHIDPTSVQGDFDSPQVMSDAKKQKATDTDNGIGLGQWTFGRNANLRGYADALGKDWWTLETQLGFMVSDAEGLDARVVKLMISESKGTPSDAALYFHANWERSADTPQMAERRATYATKWMGLFSGWTKNEALAQSILAQAGTTVTGANTARANAVRSDCRSVGNAALTMKEGGLTLEEATALMADYKVNGEAFLQARYPSGGPDDCGYGKADNCVAFSTYFVNKYTSFQKYAPGNGIDIAGRMAEMMGKQLTKTPTVYSVASGPGSGPEGHTFVVLGIQGDQAVIGEAACGTNHKGTRAYLRPLSSITNGDWVFVDVADLITEQPAAA
jgi:hypothetical protein